MVRAAGDHMPWMPWAGRKRQPVAPTTSTWSLEDDLQQLQKTMLTMLADSAVSDVHLVVEDIDVPAHKAVLAAWSRPFRAMFTLPMLESQHKCRVVIEDAEHKHLKVVLEYLYSGRVGLNDQNVMPVSALANRYEIVPLMAQCEGYMKWRLNPSNVCRHLLAAEDHQCAYMASFALDYLAVHFDEVHHASSNDFNTNDFNALASDMVMRVLQHEGLTVDEETVFLAVDGWAKAWRQRRAMGGSTAAVKPSKYRDQEKQLELAKSAPARVERDCSNKPPSHPTRAEPDGEGEVAPSSRRSKGWDKQQLERRKSATVDGVDFYKSPVASATEPVSEDNGRRSGDLGRNAIPATQERQNGETHSDERSERCGKDAAVDQNDVSTLAKPGGSEDERQRASLVTVVARSGDDEGLSVVNVTGTVPQFVGHRSAEAASSDLIDVDVVLEAVDVPTMVGGGGTRGRTRERGHTVASSRVAFAATVDDPSSSADSGSGGDGDAGGAAGGSAGGGRVASLSLPPPSYPGLRKQIGAWPPTSADDALVKGGSGTSSTAAKEEGESEDLPEEERVCLDQLFEEIRFPLISTSFLCQVVEKSASVTGSRVAQRLLYEAYRFQAIRPASSADVDELFPGNHRVKYRGYERVLFGEGEGCVGTVDDYSSSLSEVHLVDNVQRRDEKYWLPGQPEEAYVCIMLDRVRRITKFRFQNRYSEEFELAVRRTKKEEWQVIVPCQPSGGHKDVKELDLMRKRVKARHVKISLKGRKRSCYNTSVYWAELLGF